MRWLILIHRYLGIAVGWLVVIWCLSGIVMIYVPYPAVTFDEHIEALPTLDLGACCAAGLLSLPETGLRSFSIETSRGEPTLTVADSFGRPWRLGLATGRFVDSVSADDAVDIARERTAHWPGRGEVRYLGLTTIDQWTVGSVPPGTALHHVALGDPAGTRWYLDEQTGELVQATTRRERIWNWVGSVAHWLYPTALRRTGQLWADVVIWTTVVALFLTVVGLYIGIARLRIGRGLQGSPYRGLALWHHWLGLAFGLLTLTWLGSGLLSMNPWGLLVPPGARPEVERLEGTALDTDTLGALLGNIGSLDLPAGTTYIESAPLLGEIYLLAFARDGSARRFAAATMTEAPLDESELHSAALQLRPDDGVLSAAMIDAPDAYYYDHKTLRHWPVYRVEIDDAERTLYYLDSGSGQLVAKIDSTRGSYRWLFTALHSLDFARLLRIRPVWDFVMIVLLVGVSAVSATGTYLGIRYLARRRRPA